MTICDPKVLLTFPALALALACGGTSPVGTEPDPIVDAGTQTTETDAGACPLAATADYCDGIPKLPSAPAIDGVMECGLTLQEVTPEGWTGSGSLPGNVSLKYAMAWYPLGAYVFLEVTDPTREPPPDGMPAWCGDAVEFFIDDDATYASAPDYDTTGTRQFIVAAPPGAVSTSKRGEVYRDQALVSSPWTSTLFEGFPTQNGYVVEAVILAQDLGRGSWSLSSGNRLGFSVGVNLGKDPGGSAACEDHLLGQFYLNITGAADPSCGGGYPSCDVNAFCAPDLLQ